MKNIFLTLLVALLSVANASAQQWKDYWTDYQWTNGWQMMSSVRINDSQVLLLCSYSIGEDYYYLFDVKSPGKINTDLKNISPSDIKTPKKKLSEVVRKVMDQEDFADPNGMIWKRREIGGHDVLIRYYTDNTTVNTAFVSTGREAQEVMNDDLMAIISGKYTTAKGVKFEFKDDGTCVFNGKAAQYSMANMGEYDSPSLHITVNGKLYEVEPTMEGMNIYSTSLPVGSPGPPSQAKLYAKLSASKNAPRWDFLSWRICCDGAFQLLNKDVLKLMRNEMFATKGFNFTDSKLQAYFRSCKWYKPAKSNAAVKLNDVETLNVALIKDKEN